jgi:hypothetical protein
VALSLLEILHSIFEVVMPKEQQNNGCTVTVTFCSVDGGKAAKFSPACTVQHPRSQLLTV